MVRRLSYRITDADQGQTIEQFLKSKGYSHQVIVSLKKTQEGIRRNDIWAYTNEVLTSQDRLDITLDEQETSEQIEPVPLRFGIVYEDEDLLVVNKPAGMPVHPSMNNHDNTLANAVRYYSMEKKEEYPYRCINRLDRDTTGLLIIAKNALAAAGLYVQMRERGIHRTYLALIDGMVKEAGMIDRPIARKDGSTIERCVDMEHGERAVTHYEPIAWGDNWTLVRCRLETGRTHQIRVHMKYIGHPLPGDFLYNPEDQRAGRQMLHSASLDFVHPVTGVKMHLEQELPQDMISFMEKYRTPTR